MKRHLDLSDPKVKLYLQLVYGQTEKALLVKQRVESAVIPVFTFNRARNQWEQTGSAVALEIKGNYFLLTAAHVFGVSDKNRLWVGLGDSVIPLAGNSMVTHGNKNGAHFDDPVDAGVLHVLNEIPKELVGVSITLDDIDFQCVDDAGCMYFVSGYRSSGSKIFAGRAKGRREIFISREINRDKYDFLGVDRNIQLCVAYGDQNPVNGKWQTTPRPKGFSGGAVIRVHGVPAIPYSRAIEDKGAARQLLSGITIEQRREVGNKPGVLVATKVKVHLEMIEMIIPGLL